MVLAVTVAHGLIFPMVFELSGSSLLFFRICLTCSPLCLFFRCGSLVKSSRIIASSIFGIIWRILSMLVESPTQYLSYLLFLFSMNFHDFLWVLLLAITFSSSFLLNVLFSSLYLKFSDMVLYSFFVSLLFSFKFSIQDLSLSHFF